MLYYEHSYDEETGEEDLTGTFNTAIYNLRLLVEMYDWDYLDAAEEVTQQMDLTYQEFKKLVSKASIKYESQHNATG